MVEIKRPVENNGNNNNNSQNLFSNWLYYRKFGTKLYLALKEGRRS